MGSPTNGSTNTNVGLPGSNDAAKDEANASAFMQFL